MISLLHLSRSPCHVLFSQWCIQLMQADGLHANHHASGDEGSRAYHLENPASECRKYCLGRLLTGLTEGSSQSWQQRSVPSAYKRCATRSYLQKSNRCGQDDQILPRFILRSPTTLILLVTPTVDVFPGLRGAAHPEINYLL